MSPSPPKQLSKTNRFWLSYDLGLASDYGPLYTWLDKIQARECGDSVATFTSNKTREELKKELIDVVRSTVPSGRLYLIGKNSAGKIVGGFILGGRKRPSWSGFAQDMETGEEE
jgi:hypothetical protein